MREQMHAVGDGMRCEGDGREYYEARKSGLGGKDADWYDAEYVGNVYHEHGVEGTRLGATLWSRLAKQLGLFNRGIA